MSNGGSGGGNAFSAGSSGVASVVGMMLGTWLLPGTNTVVNSLIGLMLGAALEYAFVSTRAWFASTRVYQTLVGLVSYRYSMTMVFHVKRGRFESMSKHIISLKSNTVSSCTYMLDLDNQWARTLQCRFSTTAPIVDTFQNHTIVIQVVQQTSYAASSTRSAIDGSNTGGVSALPNYVLFSNTADTSTLSLYVEHVHANNLVVGSAQSLNTTSLRMLNLTLPIVQSASLGGKDKIVWSSKQSVCSKTLANTQVHFSVARDFYDNISHFLTRKDMYQSRGLVHQRGYFLHSPPGCGKTAMIKAVASMHQLQIIAFDMSVIKTSETFVTLVNEMSNQIRQSFATYILLFEDIDRCEALLRSNEDTAVDGISMSSLLNAIDGVDEPHSRLVIMTANDATMIERHSALVRPGRVDVTIAIPYVDDDQLQRMMRVYFAEFNVESLFLMRSDNAQRLADEIFHGATPGNDDDDDDAPMYRLSVESDLVSTMVVAHIQRNLDEPLRALEALTRIVAC